MTFQGGSAASFPGFPTVQVFDRTAIKIWTVRRLANKAGWSAGT